MWVLEDEDDPGNHKVKEEDGVDGKELPVSQPRVGEEDQRSWQGGVQEAEKKEKKEERRRKEQGLRARTTIQRTDQKKKQREEGGLP